MQRRSTRDNRGKRRGEREKQAREEADLDFRVDVKLWLRLCLLRTQIGGHVLGLAHDIAALEQRGVVQWKVGRKWQGGNGEAETRTKNQRGGERCASQGVYTGAPSTVEAGQDRDG